jgi:hypothetical protein
MLNAEKQHTPLSVLDDTLSPFVRWFLLFLLTFYDEPNVKTESMLLGITTQWHRCVRLSMITCVRSGDV